MRCKSTLKERKIKGGKNTISLSASARDDLNVIHKKKKKKNKPLLNQSELLGSVGFDLHTCRTVDRWLLASTMDFALMCVNHEIM